MESEIMCPICGKMARNVYRRKSDNTYMGCEHCADLPIEEIGFYDKRNWPEDYAPPKIRCPKCGEFCRKVYRTARYGDFIGCDKCVTELDAAQDADVIPEEYGLEPEEEDKK